MQQFSDQKLTGKDQCQGFPTLDKQLHKCVSTGPTFFCLVRDLTDNDREQQAAKSYLQYAAEQVARKR